MITMNELDQTTLDFIYLLACGLKECKPLRQRVEEMNLERLYSLAKFHTLTGIVYMVIESSGACSEDGKWMSELETSKLIRDWRDHKEKAIRKILLLDTERNNMCNYMEQQGIWYLPLKGIILKDLYPKLGMRQMADNDILYDSSYQMKLKDYMISRGYTVVSIGKGNHDIYEKPPIYNYELHTSLYGDVHDKEWVDYYSNVKDRLIHDEGCNYGYHFTVDDFYVYIVTHAYKHFKGSGTGIRFLMDIYVYLQHYRQSLHWTYIKQELVKLKVEQFEEESRNLCEKLFSIEEYILTEDEQNLLYYYIGSGTYGTLTNRIEKKLHEIQVDGMEINTTTKLRYMWKRLFPDAEWYRSYAPVVYAHRWLIVPFIPFRMIRGLVCKSKKIMNEFRVLRKLGE